MSSDRLSKIYDVKITLSKIHSTKKDVSLCWRLFLAAPQAVFSRIVHLEVLSSSAAETPHFCVAGSARSVRVSLKVSYGVLVAARMVAMSPWVSLVVSDRGCGRKVLQKVSQEVSPVVSPVSPIGLGFLGVSLVVFDCVCGCGVLLVVLDCGCGWEVSRAVLCGVLLVVFDRGFGWEVLCWEVAWHVSCGV